MAARFAAFVAVLLVVSTVVFGVYALLMGPNVENFERVDDRCFLRVYHDHRLFEADLPETRDLYCEAE